MSHTPGPWAVGDKRGVWAGPVVMADSGRRGIAFVCGESDANARLIAAAPDLLDAVEELLIYLADWDDPDNDTCQRARAAVAKVKGESK